MKHFKYNKSYTPLTSEGAEKLVKIIKNSNTEIGILLMKNVHDSFYRTLNKRRVFTKYQRPEYTWEVDKMIIRW